MSYNRSMTKACTKCKEVKELTDFYTNKTAKSGYNSWCKKCIIENSVSRRKANPDSARIANLKSNYGITVEQFEQMLADQDGKCAVCKTEVGSSTQTFHVDHDHECCPGHKTCGNCIRGLLCMKCNRGLGQFDDQIERLQSAINYLTNNKDLIGVRQ